MATRFEGDDKLAFLLRRHSTKDMILIDSSVDLRRRIERSRIDKRFGARNANHLCNGGNRTRIVARDDVERNALVAKICNGVGCRRSDLVADCHETQGFCPAFHIPLIGKTINGSNNENAAGIGKSVHCSLKGFIDIGGQDKLRSPHYIRTLLERSTAPFLGRREGNNGKGLGKRNVGAGIVRDNSLTCLVGVCRSCLGNVRKSEVDQRSTFGIRVLERHGTAIIRSGVNASNLHFSRCNSARLVQAKNIDTGKRFDTVQLLRQDSAASQANRRNCENR